MVQEYGKERKTLQKSRGCCTSAGNELIKREKGGKFPGGGGGGQEGWRWQMEVFFFPDIFFFSKPGLAHVCEEEGGGKGGEVL